MNISQKIQQVSLSRWLLAALMLFAFLIRLRLNYTSYLTAGTDGMYYPLQVRSLLENFHLALPDMPLLFIIDAIVAKFLMLTTSLPSDDCILFAIRYMDAALPVLAIIPLALIVRQFHNPKLNSALPIFILITFCLFNFSTVILNMSGLQKNSSGIVLIFFFIYTCIKVLKDPVRKNFAFAATVLVVCLLIHFGSFCVALLFLLISITLYPFYYKQDKKLILRFLLVASIFIIVLGTIIILFDSDRFFRLMRIPAKVFVSPAILSMIRAANIGIDSNPLNLITLGPLIVLAFIVFLFKRKQMDKMQKLLAVSLLLLSFILIVPLTGVEWYNRFLLIAFAPVTVLYVLLFNLSLPGWIKALPVTVFSMTSVLSLIFGFADNRDKVSISAEAYSDFKTLSKKLHFSDSAVVISRQDLRILSAWEFKTKISPDYLLTKNKFSLYDIIYMIRQIKGELLGRLRDIPVPAKAQLLCRSEYFEIFSIEKNNSWLQGTGKPPIMFGKVREVGNQHIIVTNPKTGRTRDIWISDLTVFHPGSMKNKIDTSAIVEIWGSGLPFSLDLNAELIMEVQQK